MKRFLCLLLCLTLLAALLSMPVAAEDSDLLQSRGDQFIKSKGLTEEDFAVYFYDTKTRAEYVYNENAFFPVGNDWILPLHMYFYEHETRGDFNPEFDNPDEIFTIEGMTLEQCRYNSIIMGKTEVAKQMRDYLGSSEQYLMLINAEYGHLDPDTLPDSYFRDNCYSATFLMNCLKRVTDHPELFRDMMQNFRLVQTDDGFAGYNRQYSYTHIRGEEAGFVCDVGEISGSDTYLLVCFASEEAGGDDLLADVNALFFKYVEELNGEQQNTTPTDEAQPWRKSTDYQPSSSSRRNDSGLYKIMLVSLAGAAVAAGIIALVIHQIRRREDRRREERKLEEERRENQKRGGSKHE